VTGTVGRVVRGLLPLAVLLLLPGAAGAAVRLNQIQVVGTHNSYHQEVSPAEARVRAAGGLVDDSPWQYTHAPLVDQLARQGVRQLELDLYADPDGGRYAAPQLRARAGEGPYDPAMLAPGTKVLHVQDYDYRSSCLTLVACLVEVEAWSAANPDHVPLAVLLELKDEPLPAGIPGAVPLPWTTARMDALDAEIRAVLPPERLLVPDDVRGLRASLDPAAPGGGGGWPALRRARGRILFLLDSDERERRRYGRGHPALAGRVAFTSSRPGRRDAAFVRVNDPRGAGLGRIRRLVRRGYAVRTRADADTAEARRGDRRRARRALRSGAHWVSTDYPAPGLAARFGTDYAVRLPGGLRARCNPVSAPPRCRSAGLER